MTIASFRLAPLLLLLAAGVALPSHAQQPTPSLAPESIVELERSETAADGTITTRYVKPDTVVPGDRVRITLRFDNRGREPVTNLKLRNPIAAGLQFDGTPDLAGFTVSVDGGTNWGDLSALTLTATDGTTRSANMGDVTHIMWILPDPVLPGTQRTVRFFARVR